MTDSSSIITLDLDGLLNQLSEIGEGVTGLKSKVQSHSKSISDNE